LYKKLISILLASLLIFNSCGYIFAYYELLILFKSFGKARISKYIPDSELTQMRIPKKDMLDKSIFEWVKPWEFRFHGKMYDIKNEADDNEFVVFYCLLDENENLLAEAFDAFYKSQTDSKYPNPIKNILNLIIETGITPEYNEYVLYNYCTEYIISNQYFFTKFQLTCNTK